MWSMEKITIIPVIIDTTGTVYNGIMNEIALTPGNIDIEILQRIAIVGSAYVWRRFNETVKH